MKLQSYVKPELERLVKRLNKNGIDDISNLDYQKYLNTALWKKIKKWIFERDENTCAICLHKKLEHQGSMDVHHRSYVSEVLDGRNEDLLVTLCRRCHRMIEFYSNNEKRTSLNEKDEEYFRLKNLHEEIVHNGLELSLNITSSRGIMNIEVKYTGNKEYKVFYSFDSLLFSFVYGMYSQYRDELRLPLPFGTYRFLQKTGGRIIDRKSNKEVIRVKLLNGVGNIRVSKSCLYSVHEILLKTINNSGYWYIHEESI